MALRIIVGTILLIFAAVQFNDPDPLLWVLAYSIVGIVVLWSAGKQVHRMVLFALIIVFAVTAAWYVPKMMNWVNDGMPSIVGEMKASTPHIEWMREFLGLVVCLIVLLWVTNSKYIPNS